MLESIFDKVAGLQVCNLVKNRFHVKLTKFLRTAFFYRTLPAADFVLSKLKLKLSFLFDLKTRVLRSVTPSFRHKYKYEI